MCTPIKPIGGYRKNHPTEVIDEAAAKHDPPRNRPDLGAFNEFVEVRCHLRMDRELPKVCRSLNHDEPDVAAPNTTASGAKEADMVTRMQVIIREDHPPGGIVVGAFAAQDLRVQMRFHVASPRAPDIEIAVTAGLESEKHREQHTDQDQRQR